MPTLRTAAYLAAIACAVASPARHRVGPPPGPKIPFSRLDTWRLEVPEPGVAVIRDSVAWWTLWRYFGRYYPYDWNLAQPDSFAHPPPVDFREFMIIAVGYGSTSGCGNQAVYINRIESDGRHIRVVLGEDEPPEPELTCMMIIHPVDVVTIPKDQRRVTFVGARTDYPVPPKARWLRPPSVDAALDSGSSVLKVVSWRVLPSDSTLSFKDLRRLVRGAAAGVGPGAGLLANPRVKANAELLTILGRGPHASRPARELLFQLHGDAVARDARSDTATLAIVIEGLRGSDHPDIAQPVTRNPVVRKDERLLRQLIRQVYADSVTCHTALAIYASRWPLERTLPSVDPRLARVSESIGCGAPPDLTRRALPIIRVAHVCGTTFRLRNELATAADITWDVDGTEEAGHLVLPPRGRRPYAEGWLTTSNRGSLRLYRDGRMFAIIGNSGGRPCGDADTIPPVVPLARLFFPDDTGQAVVPASDSTVRFYRTLVRATFYDTTGGDQVRSALERWHAAIVAGGPYPSPYVLRLPDPGSRWSACDSLLGALRETPGVQDAVPVIVRERGRP